MSSDPQRQLGAFWDDVYESRNPGELSWFQREPSLSLELLTAAGVTAGSSVLDVGGGASSLVDRLIDQGCRVGVLDVSEAALCLASARLGSAGGGVEWFHEDVRTFAPPHRWDAWHDRAVFHFLTDPGDRSAYKKSLERALAPDGCAIIATFGPSGPERCSGLPTLRYGPSELADEFGGGFRLESSRMELHRTPRGVTQEFVYCVLRRRAG